MRSISILGLLLSVILVMQANIVNAEETYILKSYPLKADLFVLQPLWPNTSGEIASLSSTTGSMDETTHIVLFEISGDDLQVKHDFPIPGWPSVKPKSLLPDMSILALEYSTKGRRHVDPRIGVQYHRIDLTDGLHHDITPSNLTATTQWSCPAGPPLLWTKEFGLAQFIYDQNSHCVSLWQGTKLLVETQHTPLISGCGETFKNGKYTRVEVTEDGAVLVFDHQSGLLVESADYSNIGQSLKSVLPVPDKQPTQLVLTPDLAIFKNTEHNSFTIVSADGEQLNIPCISSPDQSLEEYLDAYAPEKLKNLDEQDMEELYRDYLLGFDKGSGRELPPEVITMRSFITPVNETCVGVFDKTYQRLITIELQR